jgi:hypothetical protein
MKMHLIQLRKIIREVVEDVKEVQLPPGHHIGMEVPHGGSCCANCKHADPRDDGPHCTNKYWGDAPKELGGGGGDTRLPVDDAKDWCCDVYVRGDK